ncbi:MAG: alpha/beta fold hydrolase [Haloferacaceae archaeon]
MERVTHHGRATAYRVDGAGEAANVLCVHGSGTDHRVWRGQRRLADGRAVVALDLAGHGDSDDVDAAPGYECLAAYVDDVVAVAEATDARVLCGHSLGGAVALTIAVERDLDLDGLVLTGTGARLAVLDDLLEWLDDDFERALDFLHRPDRLFHDVDEGTLERSREVLRATGRAVTARDFRTCHTFDIRDRLAAVDVPALAVVGEHDRLTPPWYHEQLAERLPDCELAVVEGAAHAAMLERPEPFNATVEHLLDRMERG